MVIQNNLPIMRLIPTLTLTSLGTMGALRRVPVWEIVQKENYEG